MADPITAAATAFAQWATAAFIGTTGVTSLAAAQAVYTTAYAAAYVGASAAVTVGLSALARAQVPDAEAGKVTKRQSRPPRQYLVGGPSRFSGAYMLRESTGSKLAVVLALAEGRLSEISAYYLHDDVVTLDGSGWVQEGENGRYGTGDLVKIETRLGLPTETHYGWLTTDFSSVWPTTSTGDGIASLMMWCQHRSQESQGKLFPNGEPIPSVVGRAVCYDWRDEAQDRDDPATWAASSNPVIWLVHCEWARFGRSWDRCIAPVLDDLTAEADACDALVARVGGTEPRYRCAGNYQSNIEPQAVREAILATMDGWLSTNGKGHLVVKCGRYVAPTFTLTAEHIEGFVWRAGMPDEEAVNELIVSYVSPAHHYTEVECDPWRNEADIALTGRVRTENLQLSWVSHHTQARRLAKRKMSRLCAARRGVIRTDLHGLNALGERYIRIQNPEVPSMADVVVEVMNVEVDFNTATVSLDVILADQNIDAWSPGTEEGTSPSVTTGLVPTTYVESPTNFSATVDGSDVDLSWRNPFDARFRTISIYRATDSVDFGDATLLEEDILGGVGELMTFTDTPGSPDDYSYWIVAFDLFGEPSAEVGPETVTVP